MRRVLPEASGYATTASSRRRRRLRLREGEVTGSPSSESCFREDCQKRKVDRWEKLQGCAGEIKGPAGYRMHSALNLGSWSDLGSCSLDGQNCDTRFVVSCSFPYLLSLLLHNGGVWKKHTILSEP